MKTQKKRALVISGGGAWGAWGGGTIQGLIEIEKKEYDLIVGASTGSLLSPLVALGELSRLKEAYTNVTQKDIFNVNPFTKTGDINILNAVWRVLFVNNFYKIFKKNHIPTLGESLNLKKTIKNFFTEYDFEKIKKTNKEIIATVVNLTSEDAEFKSSKKCKYEDFIDWIWVSANVPVFMTLLTKDGNEYVDGGVVEHIPIQEAINKGATEIDVIIHRTENYIQQKYVSKNVLDLFLKIIDVMHKEISKNDINISKLRALEEEVTINLYYTPYVLSKNSLIFNQKNMAKWWDIGYNDIKNKNIMLDVYSLKKGREIKKIK